jgi:hypothetical protein
MAERVSPSARVWTEKGCPSPHAGEPKKRKHMKKTSFMAFPPGDFSSLYPSRADLGPCTAEKSGFMHYNILK